jgi:starvation-inducible DNA-binding protein
METQIGIKPEHLADAARSLNKLLADEHVLYIKTRNAHWNIQGPDFHAQHKFFEEQYGELEEMIDEAAERVRALGHYAVATMQKFLELTHLTEEAREKNDSEGFIKELLEDHTTIIMHLRDSIDRYANEWHDIGTSDFVTGLLEKHEKMAWMLRADLR